MEYGLFVTQISGSVFSNNRWIGGSTDLDEDEVVTFADYRTDTLGECKTSKF